MDNTAPTPPAPEAMAAPSGKWCPFSGPRAQFGLGGMGTCLEDACMAWSAGRCLRLSPAAPAAVREAEARPFDGWLADRVIIDGETIAPAMPLFEDYIAWCRREGVVRPMSQTTFGRALGEAGVPIWGKDPFGRRLRKGARLKATLTPGLNMPPPPPPSAPMEQGR